MTRAVNVLFFVWGVVIVGLHLHAESYPNLAQCKSQVRPWLMASPACSLVSLDCYEFAIDGQRDDIEAQWSAFEALMVVRVVIKHCSNLEIPPTLQTFRNLNGIKIYNSTLMGWGVDAELTNIHTPKIMSVLLVRVNLTDGVLPLGLQASDFPATLNDFEFSMTNLAELPDDLDLKWPRFATVYLEFSQLTYVPDVIVRLAPIYLSFAGSPIEELPAALFETSGITYIDIGWTKVSLLPSNVKSMSPSVEKLVVQGTQIEQFWSWIDAWLAIKGSKIYAWKTPYCEYLERVLSGQVTTSTPSPISNAINVYVAPEPGTIGGDIPILSPVLSNYSEANWAFLEHKVICAPRKTTVYNLIAEDVYSGILAA
uniref:Leucine-rich repeat-containing N-terminal plant-type domain-containing protein n=1 Tax=Globisporangium ultimum (strain ATCC 200006 / CBS 805.95 / DAOM BR144) TaxID=431595 RepID=K3WCV1_GLOUD